jgi:lauroyl/myristoyl acyltransferase
MAKKKKWKKIDKKARKKARKNLITTVHCMLTYDMGGKSFAHCEVELLEFLRRAVKPLAWWQMVKDREVNALAMQEKNINEQLSINKRTPYVSDK